MDGAAGLVTGEAGLKNIVKSQADIKSGIGKGPGGPGPGPGSIFESSSKEFIKINTKSNPQSLIQQQIAHELAQVRTASRIGNRVVKVGTRAAATQQNAQDSTKKSNYSGQSQQKSGKTTEKTGSAGNEKFKIYFDENYISN